MIKKHFQEYNCEIVSQTSKAEKMITVHDYVPRITISLIFFDDQ